MKFNTKEERDKFILDNMNLVNYVVNKKIKNYNYYDYTIDDLKSIGYIGLIKAVDKFDKDKGFKFSSYAIPMIIGEIFQTFREVNSGIRYGRKILLNKSKIEYMKGFHKKNYKQIADELNMTEEIVEIIEKLELCPFSLNRVVKSNSKSGVTDKLQYVDLVQDENSENYPIDDKLIVDDMLKSLNKKYKNVMIDFIIKDIPQYEIAKRLGITQQGVNYIVQQSLEKLREVV